MTSLAWWGCFPARSPLKPLSGQLAIFFWASDRGEAPAVVVQEFGCKQSFSWCFLLLSLITSCTCSMFKSSCIILLVTYHGALVISRSLPNCIFTCERLLQMYVAKDIQSLYRYLRKMKEVFKELRVLVEKGKVAPHKLTKIYWKRFLTIFTSTTKF